jgi:N-methylhydantoinase A
MARSLAPDDDPLQHADEVAQVVSERFASDVGRPPDEIIRSVDMRYRGQSHEMNIVFGGADEWTVIVERFHRAHHQRNGFSDRARPVEVTTVRASVRGTPVVCWDDLPPVSARGEPDRGRRQVMFAGSWHESAVWWRPALQAGARLSGPAVVEEPEATILLEPGDMAIVGERGELEVTW